MLPPALALLAMLGVFYVVIGLIVTIGVIYDAARVRRYREQDRPAVVRRMRRTLILGWIWPWRVIRMLAIDAVEGLRNLIRYR